MSGALNMFLGNGGGSSGPDLTTGLISYWEFGESAGSATFADSTGANSVSRNGTFTSIAGKVGNGLVSSNGTVNTNYLRKTSPSGLVGNNSNAVFSYGGWFRLVTTGNTSTWMGGCNNDGLGAPTFSILYNQTASQLSISKRRQSVSTIDSVPVTLSLSSSVWYFFVVVVSGSACTVYKDNVVVANSSFGNASINLNTQMGFGPGVFTGGANGGPGGYGLSNFGVDQCFYYNIALSALQVDALYNSGNGRSYASL